MSGNKTVDASYAVSAGKWRRYHGEGWRQLLDVETILKNIRDFFKVMAGIWQAFWLIGKLKPQVMFTPGGFVGVPVGIACRLRGVPVITHDLDAHPGIANRINGRWAVAHAVGQPKELYSYPSENTYYVGAPVASNFQKITPELQKKAKQELGLKGDDLVLFVTGGGLGATRLNAAVVAIARQLFDAYSNLTIIQTAGRGNEEALQMDYNRALSPKEIGRVHLMGFTTELYKYSAAADVVIGRAGATAMAELAVQNKASIIVPNPVLTGGHQLKNVVHLEKDDAIRVVQEKDLMTDKQALFKAVKTLLDDAALRQALGKQFGTYAKPEAAHELAELIIRLSKKDTRETTAQ